MKSASPEILALLDACRAAPADDTPRLILADWLEERGENDRSAFIRAQVELSHPTADSTRTTQLKNLERALFVANAEEWVGDLYRIRATKGLNVNVSEIQEISDILERRHKAVRFHRGLITLRNVPSEHVSWPEVLDALRSGIAPWIECIEAGYDDTQEFVRCPYARHAAGRLNVTIKLKSVPRLQGHDERGSPILVHAEPSTPATWRRFVQCSNFSAIQILTVLGEDGTELLRQLGGEEASQLVGLYLECKEHLQDAATIAAQSPFHALATLSIGKLDTAALQTLCSSEHFRNLQTLNPRDDQLRPLPIGDIDDEGLIALCESPLANTLIKLTLQNTGIGDAGVAALARSRLFERIHGPSLNLMMNNIGDAGLAALAASPGLLRFRELVLRDNSVGDDGVVALAKSPYAANLAYLDFWNNKLGDYAAFALAESPYLNSVADLSVKENFVTDDGMLALQERFGDKAKG